MRGAEAIIRKSTFLGCKAVRKIRTPKTYRNRQLDLAIRESRTKREARVLARAKQAGIICPVVYYVDEFSILMKFIEGKMLHRMLQTGKITSKHIKEAAKILAKLHEYDIIHGDYTPANLMVTSEGMAVIDFGLSFISQDVEDKATDLVTMKHALGSLGEGFVRHYLSAKGSRNVVEAAIKIESRARYMERI
ncbi:MAG: KEOPS complex kinase/ATPase Bud32 [Candidatus Anstonellaceae archaeon]